MNRSQYQYPFLTFRNQMDRLFDDFWTGEQEQPTPQVWSPPCEVSEDKDHFLVTLEMAGIPKDEIRIEVLDNQLVIAGERKSEERSKEKGLMYTERKFGKFQRSFNLPTGLNTDKIEAHYEDGVLRVLVPKAETARPRQIKIGSGSQTGFFGKLIGKDKSVEAASAESQN